MNMPTARITAASIVMALAGALASSSALAEAKLPSKAEAMKVLEQFPFEEPELFIGDDAPALEVAGWAQGEPVTGFGDGRIYVVEMWATWCGPCIRAIPHLHELSEQYKDDVTFIGMNIWERGEFTTEERRQLVENFMEGQPKMTYTVAFDDGRRVAETWMDASGNRGIPSAFIVDRDGKIAWNGHPMEMDAPLAAIVAGDMDASDARQQAIFSKKGEVALQQGLQRLATGDQSGYEVLGAVVMTSFADNPIYAGWIANQVITSEQIQNPDLAWAESLAAHGWTQSGNSDARAAHVAALASLMQGNEANAAAYHANAFEAAKDDAATLNSIAWMMVTGTPDYTQQLASTAVKMANRAVELTNGEDADILDTLARAVWESGDRARAVEIQRQAVNAASEDRKPSYERNLENYLNDLDA